MSTWHGTLLVAVLIVAVLGALWTYATAHRLDRLHVRTDAAWLALDSALGRRAVVARAVVLAGTGPGADPDLASIADRAERASRATREAAENALSAALATLSTAQLSPQAAAELADAQARVLLARRFHNDAVRDALALHRRRSVRLLRLGGTAAAPTYFEIAESPLTSSVGPPRRPATRVLLIDEQDQVCLLRGRAGGAERPPFWFTTGGGVEPGETPRAAGVREVAEETGLTLVAAQLRGPLWWRRSVFVFDGATIEAEETYFAAAVANFAPRSGARTELEHRMIDDARWCTAADIQRLEAAGDNVYPPGLADLLGEAVQLVRAPDAAAPPRARDIGATGEGGRLR